MKTSLKTSIKTNLLFLLLTCCLMTCFCFEAFAGAAALAGKGTPYIAFYAQRTGKNADEIDLSRAVCLVHFMWECEGSWPTQSIRDEETIRIAAERIQNIYVTGGPDGIFSTAGGHAFTFMDEEENVILSISIQEGMIETPDGRYEAAGLAELSDIPGIMTPGDWSEYYDRKEEEEEEYRRTHTLSYPCSLFEARGKEAFGFYSRCTADDILSIYLFHAGKNTTVTDRDAIRALYESLCRMQVTGPGKASRWDDSWSITIFYQAEDETFESSIRFSFRSGALDLDGEDDYAVEGLSGILNACDWKEWEVIAGLIG